MKFQKELIFICMSLCDKYTGLQGAYLRKKPCLSFPGFQVKATKMPSKSKQSPYNLIKQFLFLNRKKIQVLIFNFANVN